MKNQERLFKLIKNITLKLKEKRDLFISLKLEQPTLESGLEDLEMDLESKYGLMVLSMRGNGKTIELMVTESLFILMEIFMKEIGLMTKPMDLESICM